MRWMWSASSIVQLHLSAACCLRHFLSLCWILWEQGSFGVSHLWLDVFSYTWASASQLSLIDMFPSVRALLWGKLLVVDRRRACRQRGLSSKKPEASPGQAKATLPPWLAANTAAGRQTHPCHSAANKNICCLASHLSTGYGVAQRRWAGNHMLTTEAHWMWASCICF